MTDGSWKSYLPRYRLPRALTTCFGCLALLMLGGGLLIFLGLPALFSTINSLDPEPILDVGLEASVTVGELSITLIGIEDDTRCPGPTLCSPPGSVRVLFRTTLDDLERSLVYPEGAEYADLVALPGGYALRVLSVTPDSSAGIEPYVVRVQLFLPPSE